MNPPSVDIADLLEAETSLGLVLGTNLHVSEIPAAPNVPDKAVVVYDSGGEAAEAGYSYERPTVQVFVRGDRGAYVLCHQLAQLIRDRLNGSYGEVVNGARYVGIWLESDILFIGYDDSHRPQVTVNFRLHRTESS